MGMATSQSKLDQVFQDVKGIRDMMKDSQDFRLMIDTPSIDPATKIDVLNRVLTKAGGDDNVKNFLKVLIENKRLNLLARVIDVFETMYRAEKGIVLCQVTSAKALSTPQQQEVKAAMEKRAAKGSQLNMEFGVNPALMGGLVVKMGE